MRNGLLLLVALLVVVVVCVAAWWRGDDPSMPAPAADAAVAARDASAPTPDAAPAIEATAAPARTAGEAPAVDGAVGPANPLPANAKHMTIRVLDAGTKAAVPGAEVRWQLGSSWRRLQTLPEAERGNLYSEPDAMVRLIGWLTKADDQGVARVAYDEGHVTVFASADGRYGTGSFDSAAEPPPGGFTIAIEPDLTLRARVRGPAGEPRAGVPLEVRTVTADGKAMHTGWVRPVRTAADGIATFSHVQQWMRRPGRRLAEGTVWSVRMQVPGLDDPGVAFDPASPPAEPVELSLPATGAVLASLRHQGQLITKDVTFQLWRGAEDDNEPRNRAHRFPPDADGHARIDPVALGGELRVRGTIGHAEVVATIQAPRGADETVRAELTTDGLYVLAGLLVGPDGEPLRDAQVQTEFDLEIISGGGMVATDAQGRFVWFLTRGHRDTAEIGKLVFSRQGGDAPALRASVPPRTIQRGVTELGAIQMSAGPLVVAGRIVTDSPARRGNWHFEVEALTDLRSRDGAEVWERVDALTRSHLAEGRFEVRGDTRPVRHRLRFGGFQHLPMAPIEFAVGAKDLEIRIATGHSLVASVRFDEGLAAPQVRAVLQPKFEPPPEPPGDEHRWMGGSRYGARHHGHQNGEAHLHWDALPAGTYDLSLFGAAPAVPLLTIADVVVPQPVPGDARLTGIDARGRVRVVQLAVTFAAGTEASRQRSQAIAFVQPQPDEQEWRGVSIADTGTPLALPVGDVELLVCAEGCVPKRVVVTGERTTVALEPFPQAELTFLGLPALPEGVTMHVSLNPETPAARSSARYRTEHRSGELDSLLSSGSSITAVREGRARVAIGEGAHRVGVFFRKQGVRRSGVVSGVVPGTILGGANLAPIELQLPAESVQQALAKLQKPPK